MIATSEQPFNDKLWTEASDLSQDWAIYSNHAGVIANPISRELVSSPKTCQKNKSQRRTTRAITRAANRPVSDRRGRG